MSQLKRYGTWSDGNHIEALMEIQDGICILHSDHLAHISKLSTLLQAARNAMSVRTTKETREQSTLNNALVALLADYDKGDGRG